MSWAALIDSISDPIISRRLCLALLHSLWQGLALALVAWAITRLPKRMSTRFVLERSYAICVALLVASLALVPVTFWFIDVDRPDPLIADVNTILNTLPARATAEHGLSEKRSTAAKASGPSTTNDGFKELAVSHPTSARDFLAEPATMWDRTAPWVVTAYALGVLVMLGRLLLGIWHAQRLARSAVRITDGVLFDQVAALARTWSMRVVPAIAHAEKILVPKVVGLVRPVILFPAATITGLSADELGLIIAHELAHITRYDMWVFLLQRVAESVLFFNPAVWLLSRQISTLREYCCDEMACQSVASTGAEPRLRYATALLHVVELNMQAPSRRGGKQAFPTDEITALAVSGRSPSELRRRIARLVGEPLPEPVRLSRGGIVALALVAALVMVAPPAWISASAPEDDKAKDTAATDGAAAPKVPTFDLLVVGPDGKPLPNIEVEFRTDQSPTAEQITHGAFVRKAAYGSFARTDDDGRVTLALRKVPVNFSAMIQTPGFGPYCAKWEANDHPEAIPEKFTAELDKAWSVGGVIVDEQGSPLAGVKVTPRLEFKKRPGDTRQFGAGARTKTDAFGKWRFDSVPNGLNEIHVEITSPNFMALRRSLTRSEFGIKEGDVPTTKIALDPGLTVTGLVTDELGRPIEGAVVRTKFLNDTRKATTDASGRYQLVGCEPRVSRVVASAKGRAMELKEVRIDSEMDPVDFELKTGGKLRVRVLDAAGNPAPKARIFFQQWRGRIEYFEFDSVNQYANQLGVWEWNEAPLDEILVDVCPVGGMQMLLQPLKARDEEYVFHTNPLLVITGKVTDVDTGKPIGDLRAFPASVAVDGHISWNRHDGYETNEGHYVLRRNRGEHSHLVRIEAKGYEIATSREIHSDEGNIEIDFALKKAKDVAAVVTTPKGEPARRAKIAVGIVGSQINIHDGVIDDGGTYAARQDTDDSGRFSFPGQDGPYQLVITHPTGYAYLQPGDDPLPPAIKLTAWARVEGTFHVGKDLVPNAALTLNTNTVYSTGQDEPHIYTHYDVTTGDKGQFVFERVFPGDCHLGRRIMLMVKEGATEVTSSQMVAAQLTAGETTHLDLGGTGRPVIGRLIPPAGYDKKVLWSFAFITVESQLPPLPPNPSPADKAFYHSLEASRPYYQASVDPDGNFRIDDMVAANYELDVRFDWGHKVGRIVDFRFAVPELKDDEDPQKPIDLGNLRLDE
ncbi:MAG TPA: carboxypeptidase regulatory-like domain-containing protein [Pirellulales bacterium]|jgi:beta-lactamase regulating signal transducer with metallopeptidase domain/uncharacterized GH25 family protein